MHSQTLTGLLLSRHQQALNSATTHPFLAHAGTGTLEPAPLTAWLVQDKYYQFAYVQFIGRLLAKLDLSPTATSYSASKSSASADLPGPRTGAQSTGQEDGLESIRQGELASKVGQAWGSRTFTGLDTQTQSLEWKTFEVLVGAINAIKAEIEFYDEVVEKYGLHLNPQGPDETTKDYLKLFEESSAEEVPLVCGLAVLWATECVYLKAWTFAKEQPSDNISKDTRGAVAALHNEFIPNWTSDDFKAAVGLLADVTDSWAQRRQQNQEENCLKLWLRVLELETRFWPHV